jgi:hypothetical protein
VHAGICHQDAEREKGHRNCGVFGESARPKSDRQPTMAEQLDLTDDEKRALIALLRETLEYARFPLAPRLAPLKAILAKLDPPPPVPEPLLPLRSGMGPSVGRGRRRWRS